MAPSRRAAARTKGVNNKDAAQVIQKVASKEETIILQSVAVTPACLPCFPCPTTTGSIAYGTSGGAKAGQKSTFLTIHQGSHPIRCRPPGWTYQRNDRRGSYTGCALGVNVTTSGLDWISRTPPLGGRLPATACQKCPLPSMANLDKVRPKHHTTHTDHPPTGGSGTPTTQGKEANPCRIHSP